MPRDGTNGQYTLPPGNPVEPDTIIESVWANSTMQDIALALTQSIAIDGQTPAVDNLPMGGYHHTNVSDPTQRSQYASLGMMQDGAHQRIQGMTGVDNVTGTLVGGATAYVAGAFISFYAPAQNTGPMTLSYNGIGAKSLVSSTGAALKSGEIVASQFIIAYYTGTVFQLFNVSEEVVQPELYSVRLSGQERPISGTYPALILATGTSVTIPAGSAWVIPPTANTAADAIEVTWTQQTITLVYLTTSFTTTISVNSAGTIQQVAGKAVGPAFRNSAILGTVVHLNGTATKVITKPAIFGDELYAAADAAGILTNYLLSGGLVAGNVTNTLQLDVASGSIFMPGGNPNVVDIPNTYSIVGTNNITFRTLAGQNTVGGALITLAPIGSYDPGGSGVVTAIPTNSDAVVHRLYFLYGDFIWVYGQTIYTSVENACSLIEYDRTKYKASSRLTDGTLLAEIICIKNATSLNVLAQAAIIAPGGVNFTIGSAGGLSEAPINGLPYGRQDAGWSQVLGATSPALLVNAKVTGAAPKIDLVMNPYGAGVVAYNFLANTFKWAGIEVVNPDDKMYIRSYNPTNGNLRFTTTFDLATGSWTFPNNISAVGFSGNGSALTDISHLGLTSLTVGDPHTQYLNQARGDARYPIRSANFTNIEVVAVLPGTPDSNTIYFVTT